MFSWPAMLNNNFHIKSILSCTGSCFINAVVMILSHQQVELSDDDDNVDIVLEMKFSPDSPTADKSNIEYVLSPIRREDSIGSESPMYDPVASSPR